MVTNDFDAALQALLASLPPLPVPQQPTTPSQNPTDAQAQQQKKQPSQASAGVLALGIGARALVGAEEGGEAGAAAGTVEPGGGNVVGAVVGAVAGAATAALAPTIYSKAKDEAAKGWTKFKTALAHHEKLSSSPNQDPRGGWKQTMRRVANEMDRHADNMGQGHQTAAKALRFGADLVRGLIPDD
jgi:phage tail tape-measure protein